ncbi:hypothetical protein LTR78_001556 [Recurvomyces mirabilis]|uniref:Uncharacterized protein n=1 Tax=Recurvomyces mirabilis TaxID=574656 RepID=A0AAE1C515_9PEZI|nr:hypothetical protein LTR78_001556 [Recurvomyces mirabilis]KAK5151871.1 hypothetical protein LTS14_009005 [Recurvomyces mirabilis]
MLPPQARSGLLGPRRHSLASTAPTCLLRQASVTSAATQQSRSFWGWRRRGSSDWESHIDPMYHRFTRYRTMKTRAKLIEKFKRRANFYDADQRPFFTPKHIRFASHFNGRGRWPLNHVRAQPASEQDAQREDGYELSQREQEWKERMEYMRKQIQNDPYEAVFGKRFEPFWSPLVPSWMREEMGMQRQAKQPSKPEELEREKSKIKATRIEPSRQSSSTGQPPPVDSPPVKTTESIPSPKTKSYASYSSSSWDSWSNTARLEKWDSVSNELKQFVYDPISNRMVAVKPLPAVNTAKIDLPKPEQTNVVVRNTLSTTALASRSQDMRSLINTPRRDIRAVEVPVKQYKSAKPAPESSMDVIAAATKEAADTLACLKENMDRMFSHSAQQEQTRPPRPAALAKLPANDMDMLTADDVRARMGKVKEIRTVKPTTIEQKATMEADFDSKAAEWDKAENAVFQEAELETTKRKWVAKAKKEEKISRSETSGQPLTASHVRLHESYGTSKIPADASLDTLGSTLQNESSRTRPDQHQKTDMVTTALDDLGNTLKSEVQPTSRSNDIDSLADTLETMETRSPPRRQEQKLQAALNRLQTTLSRRTDTAKEDSRSVLLSAVQRMQSKELPRTDDLDDSGAHEATETVEIPTSVPKEWSNAANILQANRVKRIAAKRPYPFPVPRFAEDMEQRKAAYEASQAKLKADETKAERLKKANEVLEAEVKEQKFLMQSHENRYVHKIRSLRQELDIAYKQSAVHSEKHVERIHFLEAELTKASKAAGDVAVPAKMPQKMVQAEGDFSPDIAKFASAGKWYKQPTAPATPGKQMIARAEQKARDQALVKEVCEIYEREYGVIDTNHKQRILSGSEANASAKRLSVKKAPQVVEVESDVDLGEALAEHERTTSYEFKDDGLESRIQAEEKAAHEAQALPQLETSAELTRTITKARQAIVNANVKKEHPKQDVVLAEEIKSPSQATSAANWEEPPVYKVLAYDSGNDILSTATTTANFTGTETPISIPQALSQLYQPARFVSHFAELQQDGWQVIYGTRDMLVFRKVQASAEKPTIPAAIDEDASLVDHGLIKPKQNALAEEAANFHDRYKPAPKPYDPTSIENGKLMPYENAMAQEAAHAYDAARAAHVNPIDGTAKIMPVPEVSTGAYASPTGFVNHDRAYLDNDDLVDRAKVRAAMNKKEEDIDYIHYPRVKRQEPVYAGTRLATPAASKQRKWNERHEKHARRAEKVKARSRRRGGKLRWALGVGVGFAAVSYGIGVAAEMARQERREKERWEQVLDGKRGRWE